MKVIRKILMSLIVVFFSFGWSVQAAGLIGAVISSLNDVGKTTNIIIFLTALLSVVGIFLVWFNKISFSTKESTHFSYIICNVYFGTLILLNILYMVVLKDIKYVLLAECVVVWVIWFVLMRTIKSIEESFTNNKNEVDSVSDQPTT